MKNIVLVLICLFLAVPSSAEIIIVDDDWPYDFDNIQTVIDCNNRGPALYFQGDTGTNTVIDGLTIINGYEYGATIECHGTADLFGNETLSTLTISNCNIRNNTVLASFGH